MEEDPKIQSRSGEEDLIQITIENGYTEDAEKAAKSILSSDRADPQCPLCGSTNTERISTTSR